jgi:hypothetical protein
MRGELWGLFKEMFGWALGVLLVLYIIAILAHLIGQRIGSAIILP